MLTRRRRQALAAWCFVLPGFAVYAAFMLYPFGQSIYYSLTSWNGASDAKEFVGLDNYSRLLGDDKMWAALSHNGIWLVIGTIAPIAIGGLIALVLWQGVRFNLGFRTIFFIPFVLPQVVIGVVWSWIYDPLSGPLNSALGKVGLESVARGWLGDPSTALYAVLGAGIWATIGFMVMLIYAGLQSVDMELVDQAKVDGASWWKRTRHVVIPELAPVLTLVTSIALIGAFKVFDIVVVMTDGGPGDSSELLATYAYRVGFRENEVGYGAALSMVITTISIVLAMSFVWMRDRQERLRRGV
jgi:raffinose/stachyose/melibiose transport system permease protein